MVTFLEHQRKFSPVIKGREDFHSLSQSEQFQFKQFIEQRTRFFESAQSIAEKDGLKILLARAKEFFGYLGSITCYENLKEKELIAIPWMNFIDDALTLK